LIAVTLMLLSSAAALSGPYLVKIALDEASRRKIWATAGTLGIFLVFLIISGICLQQRVRIMSEMGSSVIYSIREDSLTDCNNCRLATMIPGRTAKF